MRKVITSSILIAMLLIGSIVQAQTTIPGGTITGDVIWDVTMSPIHIVDKFYIQSGGSLTIESGVIVECGTEHVELGEIVVQGTLIADGVTFDGTQVASANTWAIIEMQAGGSLYMTGCELNGRWTPPSSGGKDWRGIHVTGNNTNAVEVDNSSFNGFATGINSSRNSYLNISNCDFTYCNTGIGIQYGMADITDCTFDDVAFSGVTLSGGPQFAGADVSITGCKFQNSPNADGIRGLYDSKGKISGSCFSNLNYAIYSSSSNYYLAENNWWNASDGPAPSGSGELVVGDIDYEPWSVYGCMTLFVNLNIKPQSCPNPLNVKNYSFDTFVETEYQNLAQKLAPIEQTVDRGNSVIPVAILGTDVFDVSAVDVSTILLEGIPLDRYSYADVSTPISEVAETCECNTDGADGFIDLLLKFNKEQIIAALGDVYDGDVIPLAISGELLDGTPFTGEDCIVIRGKKSGALASDNSNEILQLENYPNPFNPTTEISFSLPEASIVTLEIYNINGQKVSTVADGQFDAGRHSVTWDSREAASGVYFYRLTTEEFSDTKKMILLK